MLSALVTLVIKLDTQGDHQFFSLPQNHWCITATLNLTVVWPRMKFQEAWLWIWKQYVCLRLCVHSIDPEGLLQTVQGFSSIDIYEKLIYTGKKSKFHWSSRVLLLFNIIEVQHTH